MTALPTLKLRVLPTFPASVSATAPVVLTKLNGAYTISFNITSFASTIPPTTDYATDYLLVYDSIAGTFFKLPLSSVISLVTLPASGTSGGIPYFSSTTALSSSGVLAANKIVVGGGAGTTPTTNASFSLASNVLTAGINASQSGSVDFANGGVGGASARIQNLTATVAYNFNLPGTAGTSGQPLLSGGGGTNPHTYGTLGVGAGGTGLTGGTSGGIPYYSGASAITSSAALGANNIVVGGGAGAAPAANAFFSIASSLMTAGVNAAATGAIDFASGAGGGASVRIQNPSATVAFNFNLPTAAGTAGQPLLSGAGGTNPHTYGTLSVGAGGTGQITLAAYLATFTKPTTQTFLSGSGTYTTPANVTWIEVTLVGGGSGGQGSGTGAGSSLAAGSTTFSTLTAAGGAATVGGGTPGGAGTNGDINITGGTGGAANGNTVVSGGNGGASALGGTGWGSTPGAGAGQAAIANSGGGGGGAASNGTSNSGAGGGAGAYVVKIIASPAATYSYAVGAGATGGTAGTGGSAGGNGGSGHIRVVEHYS